MKPEFHTGGLVTGGRLFELNAPCCVIPVPADYVKSTGPVVHIVFQSFELPDVMTGSTDRKLVRRSTRRRAH